MTDCDSILQQVSGIRNLSRPTHVRWLLGLAEQTSNDCYLCEIGTYYGYLSAALALSCSNSNRRVITIDHMIGGFCDFPENDRCTYVDVVDNMIRVGAWSKIVPIATKSHEAIRMLNILKPRIELLYLDGDHNEDPVFKELTDYSKFVPVGGFICGDDCLPATGLKNPFTELWLRGNVSAFYPQGVSLAVWRFFRNNQDFQVLENAPHNQFGFRRVK